MAGKLIRNTSTPELRAWWETLEALSATAPRLNLDSPTDERRPEYGDRSPAREHDRPRAGSTGSRLRSRASSSASKTSPGP